MRANSSKDPSPAGTASAGAGTLWFSVAFFSVFTNLLMLTGPLFMLQVYDRVLGSRSEETLVALFALVAALYFFYNLLEYARGRVLARIAARYQARLQGKVFGAVLSQSALNRNEPPPQALSDMEAVKSFLMSPVLLALIDMPWTPIFLAAIFIFHPILGWVAITGGLLLVFVALGNQLLTARKVAEAQKISSVAQRFSKQAEDGSDFVWAQGMGRAMSERWMRMQDEALDRSIRASDWTGSFSSFTKAFRLFLQSAMLAVGAYLVLQNQVTAGAMIAASILLGRALGPVDQSISQWPVVQRARMGRRSLNTFLAKIGDAKEPTPLPRPKARLAVTNASVVVRRGEKPVLYAVNFEVAPGEAIGVIGRSGSGKTTLARLLVGLVAPTAGEIRLDGATLEQFGSDALGRYIGYLPQDIRLFDGTVAENIAQMALEPDPARVVAAAQKARVHDIILQLPKGYDTQIGAADAQMSGGQRQRLALARALYNEPVILVLDEPNSALDAEGSTALNSVVEEMKSEGRAVIIMTHRPTAIASCDRLLVLEGGKVAAYGPRDEIIKTMMRNAGDVKKVVGAGGVS